MDRNDFVRDEEELYRSVRGELNKEYFYNDAGKLIIQSVAFLDRNRQPSVDRAELREFNPALSKKDETDGIVSLIAGDIRAIPIEDHTIDVIYAPFQEILRIQKLL